MAIASHRVSTRRPSRPSPAARPDTVGRCLGTLLFGGVEKHLDEAWLSTREQPAAEPP